MKNKHIRKTKVKIGEPHIKWDLPTYPINAHSGRQMPIGFIDKKNQLILIDKILYPINVCPFCGSNATYHKILQELDINTHVWRDITTRETYTKFDFCLDCQREFLIEIYFYKPIAHKKNNHKCDFKKQFPQLVGKQMQVDDTKEIINIQNNIQTITNKMINIMKDMVLEHCLDKEKVREDIKKSSVSIGDFRDIDKRAIVKINNHTYDNRIEMLNNLKNKKIIFVDTLVKELKL